MKTRLLTTTLVLAAGVLLPALRADETLDLTAAGLLKPEFIKARAGDLGLTTDQGAALTSIYEAAKTEAAPLEEAVKKTRLALESALKQSSVTEPAAAEKLAAVLAAEAPLKQLQLRTLLRLRARLTPAQLDAARTLQGSPDPGMSTEERLKHKAGLLKDVVEKEIGSSTNGMKRVGERIKNRIIGGQVAEGEKEIDQLLALFATPKPVLDFSSHATGDTATLKDRFDAVTAKAQEVEDLAVLRELAAARDALLKAKDSSDADTAGRILTWAEGKLKQP